MSRKSKESPLNLIRILPPKDGARTTHKFNPDSAHFKLKLDGEEASGPILSLGGLVGLVETLLHGVGKFSSWTLSQIRRAVHFITAGIENILNGFGQGLSKMDRLGQSLGGQSVKSAKRHGGGIQPSANQLYADTAPGRKPTVNESVQRERSKQREMLIDEVHALRTQLTTHQDELIRVTAQMEELKALVSSQQQVLLHLGKEIEATEKMESPQEKLEPRKTAQRRTKVSSTDKPESGESPPTNQFEFGPPHH